MEVLLSDRMLFCTSSERDPSKRVDQFAATAIGSSPMRKRPSVSSILLWMMSVMPSNRPGEFIPASEATAGNQTHVRRC